jgi:hypothetical protein
MGLFGCSNQQERPSFEIERGLDRVAEVPLLAVEQHADLLSHLWARVVSNHRPLA